MAACSITLQSALFLSSRPCSTVCPSRRSPTSRSWLRLRILSRRCSSPRRGATFAGSALRSSPQRVALTVARHSANSLPKTLSPLLSAVTACSEGVLLASSRQSNARAAIIGGVLAAAVPVASAAGQYDSAALVARGRFVRAARPLLLPTPCAHAWRRRARRWHISWRWHARSNLRPNEARLTPRSPEASAGHSKA